MESLPKLLARNARAMRDARELTEAQLVLLGVPAGSAHRGLTPDGQNMKLETLAKWSKALRTPAWLLLYPEFNPNEPPIIMTQAAFDAEVQARLSSLSHSANYSGAMLDEDEMTAMLLSLALIAKIWRDSRPPQSAENVTTSRPPDVTDSGIGDGFVPPSAILPAKPK